jgi:hypothetical protein
VLLHEIDEEVRSWRPGITNTPGRLAALEARKWRPQDTQRLETYSGRLEYWAKAIAALLDPQPVLHFSAPCPACQTRWVYRRMDDELLRQPALQITTQGCICQKCRYTWGPERFHILAGALDCPLPAGVLE